MNIHCGFGYICKAAFNNAEDKWLPAKIGECLFDGELAAGIKKEKLFIGYQTNLQYYKACRELVLPQYQIAFAKFIQSSGEKVGKMKLNVKGKGKNKCVAEDEGIIGPVQCDNKEDVNLKKAREICDKQCPNNKSQTKGKRLKNLAIKMGKILIFLIVWAIFWNTVAFFGCFYFGWSQGQPTYNLFLVLTLTFILEGLGVPVDNGEWYTMGFGHCAKKKLISRVDGGLLSTGDIDLNEYGDPFQPKFTSLNSTTRFLQKVFAVENKYKSKPYIRPDTYFNETIFKPAEISFLREMMEQN